MENVLKDLPDKIRDQLSRHHTQNKSTSNAHKPSSTCVFRMGLYRSRIEFLVMFEVVQHCL